MHVNSSGPPRGWWPLQEAVGLCDLIVEAAPASAFRELASAALGAGKALLVLSVGALLDCYDDYVHQARRHRARIYVASGAIGGLDAIAAAAEGQIEAVVMVTRKPPRAGRRPVSAGTRFAWEPRLRGDGPGRFRGNPALSEERPLRVLDVQSDRGFGRVTATGGDRVDHGLMLPANLIGPMGQHQRNDLGVLDPQKGPDVLAPWPQARPPTSYRASAAAG